MTELSLVSSVAITTAKVAAVATASALAAEKVIERNNTVYFLVDGDGIVQYVGRTTNVKNRIAAHAKNPSRSGLEFQIVKSGLTLAEAKGLEQVLMIENHTINTANRMNNQINGISPLNRKLGVYMEATRGIVDFSWNFLSNEALYWLGQ